MGNKFHQNLTDSDGIHEPKGISTANAGFVYVANGNGGGSWQLLDIPDLLNPNIDSLKNLDYVSFSILTMIAENTFALDTGNWRAKCYSQSAAGNITTTSLTPVLATGMSKIPPAGTYLCLFMTDVTNSNAGRIVKISLYKNDAISGNSERTFVNGNASDRSTAVTMDIISCNGTDEVRAMWNVSANTGTMGNRILALLKVEP